MTQDKRRDEWIKDFEKKYDLCYCTGGWVITAGTIYDEILAREKKMLDEIERPLKDGLDGYNYSNNEDFADDLYDMKKSVELAIATINKYKGE